MLCFMLFYLMCSKQKLCVSTHYLHSVTHRGSRSSLEQIKYCQHNQSVVLDQKYIIGKSFCDKHHPFFPICATTFVFLLCMIAWQTMFACLHLSFGGRLKSNMLRMCTKPNVNALCWCIKARKPQVTFMCVCVCV